MILLFKVRSFLAIIIFVIMTIVASIFSVLVVSMTGNSQSMNFIIKFWSNTTCWLFGVKVEVQNAERLKGKGGLVLFNHSSFFDIYALSAVFPHIRYGAKVELFKIPFFGAAIKKAGMLPIARQRKEEVFKVYEQAKSQFSMGRLFALSPEGGRHHGKELAQFKSGPFYFGLSAETILYPVVIHGAYECLPKGRILPNTDRWQRTISIKILEPIATNGFSRDNLSDLQQKTYTVMNNEWMQRFI